MTTGSGAPPNLVVVLHDDACTDLLDQLPAINAIMADRGAVFGRSYVGNAVCEPSRATYLRGQVSHNTGLFVNPGGFYNFRDNLEDETLPVWLKRAGYATGLFGKYLIAYSPASHVPPGWDCWRALAEPWRGQATKNVSFNGRAVSWPYHTSELYSRELSGFVERQAAAGTPFFAYVCPHSPHEPPEVRPRDRGAMNRARVSRTPSYNAFTENEPAWMRGFRARSSVELAEDDGVFRDMARSMLTIRDLLAHLFATLEQTGTLENTYVFLTSDNGYRFSHRRLTRGKLAPYEQDVRVPLMVRGPGVAAGRVEQGLVGNHDLAPTLLDPAGRADLLPAFVDGRSYAPLLRGESVPWRTALGLEGRSSSRADDLGNPEIPEYRAAVTGDAKVVLYETGETQRFDLARDPHEIYGDAQGLGHLDATADAIRAASGDALREAEGFPPGTGPA